MKKIIDFFAKRFSGSTYSLGSNNLFSFNSDSHVISGDLIIDSTSLVKTQAKSSLSEKQNLSNLNSSFFPSTTKSTFTLRSNIQDDLWTFSHTTGNYANNYSYDRVLDKNLRDKASNSFTFEDTDGTSYTILVNPNKTTYQGYFNTYITLAKTDSINLNQDSVTNLIPNYYYSSRYTRTSYVTPYYVDLNNRYIYFYAQMAYYSTSSSPNGYYQTQAIHRLPFTTDTVEGTLTLGESWEFLLPPQSSAGWAQSYNECRKFYFIGLSANQNPLYVVFSERESASYNSWYNGNPSIVYDLYISEHNLSDDSFTILHNYNASSGWGTGNDYSSLANRVQLNFVPSAFQETETQNLWVSYFPAYNTSNLMSIMAMTWDKSNDTFTIQPVTSTFQNSETMDDHFVDQYNQIVPYVYQESNTIINLNNGAYCPVVFETITASNGKKYLSFYYKQKAEIFSRFITNEKTKNLVTFEIDSTNYLNLTHVQTKLLEAYETLFLDSNNTNFVVAKENTVNTLTFSDTSFWQDVSTFQGIAYSLARISDTEFYFTSANLQKFSLSQVSSYPSNYTPIEGSVYKISMNDPTPTGAEPTVADEKALHIIISENLTFISPETLIPIQVAVKNLSGDFFNATVTLETNATTAIWEDNLSQSIVANCSSTGYISLNLKITSPGFFYISGKL